MKRRMHYNVHSSITQNIQDIVINLHAHEYMGEIVAYILKGILHIIEV